jgi:hypothetical protein
MAKEATEKESARSAIILLLVVLVVAGFCVRYGLQTLAWAESRYWARSNAWLNDAPQPLPAPGPVPDFSKMKEKDKPVLVKTSEWEFRVPWKGEPKQRELTNALEFRFETGQAVVFFDPQTQLDTLGQFKKLSPLEYEKLSNVFQGNPPATNYELYKDVYSASPAEMSPFMPLADAMRQNVLLLWKLAFGFDAQPGIHSFEWPNKRGFEFGDPAKGGPVALRVFDDRDHQFRFLFVETAGSNGKISQDDIDFVVQTLEPVPLEER